MRRLKMCPMCLGDMTMEETLGEVDSRCPLCGYRSSAKGRPAELVRHQSPGSGTAAQREWPYGSRRLRPGRV